MWVARQCRLQLAGKVRKLGPISPDFVYGSSAERNFLENQGGMGGAVSRIDFPRERSCTTRGRTYEILSTETYLL